MARSKKEIDKEIMYKKIMPTASAASLDEMPAPTAVPPLSVPVPFAPGVDMADIHTEVSAEAELPIAVEETPAVEPVNVMQTLLEGRLDAAIEKFHCCECDKCRKGIIAFTLNKLPPCYIDPQDAERMAKAESQYAGQVATALVQAILNVKSHPTH